MIRLLERRGAWSFLVLALLCGALSLSVDNGQAEGQQAPASAPSSMPSANPAEADVQDSEALKDAQKSKIALRQDSGRCLVDPTAISDLRRRSEEVEARAKALEAREQELAAQKRAVEEDVRRLTAVREEIEKLQGSMKKSGEERVAKLVETMEAMAPKGAAQLIAGVDDQLAVSAMSRLSTSKLAKILPLMSPERSAFLTEKMAGVVRAQAKKGGKDHDSENIDDASSRQPAREAQY